MRINLGIKTCSIISSMVLSLVVIAGCNEETPAPTTTPTTPPISPAPKPEMKPATPPTPTPPPSKEEPAKKAP